MKKTPGTLNFKIRNLISHNPELMGRNQRGPVGVGTGRTDLTTRLAATLNAQGGDLRFEPRKIKLFGDNAGCDFVDLSLYQDSKYTSGYISGSYSCSDETPFYDSVKCILSVGNK